MEFRRVYRHIRRATGATSRRRVPVNKVSFGRHTMKLPGNRWLRIGLGIVLILAGFVGFLPILGFWMIPLGLAVLAVDVPFVERRWTAFQPRLENWLARKFPNFWAKYMA